MIYRNLSENCFTTNSCCDIYNWGEGMPCTNINTSNTLDIFWGWLTDDEFTHQNATWVGRDDALSCDLWQHNSKPIYPQSANQIACVSTENSVPTPVYMNWSMPSVKSEFERKVFTNFVSGTAGFPANIFAPPVPCPGDGPVHGNEVSNTPSQKSAAVVQKRRIAKRGM
jgi:hypothetical protein